MLLSVIVFYHLTETEFLPGHLVGLHFQHVGSVWCVCTLIHFTARHLPQEGPVPISHKPQLGQVTPSRLKPCQTTADSSQLGGVAYTGRSDVSYASKPPRERTRALKRQTFSEVWGAVCLCCRHLSTQHPLAWGSCPDHRCANHPVHSLLPGILSFCYLQAQKPLADHHAAPAERS